jgi:type I restriction enzyme S subunit
VNAEDRDTRIGDIPYYGANGLQGYIDDFIFDEPLILIAEDGGRFDEFSTRPIAYRIAGKSWVNNHAHVLRVKENFSKDAVFYSLEHKDIQSFIVGGTRAKLNQSALRSITLLLPTSRTEQSTIGEILSAVDRVIEQTKTLITKQQRIKNGLLQDLLTSGIDNTGLLRSQQTHRFKDSLIGTVPEEWEILQLGKAVSLQRGYDITELAIQDGIYPVVSSSGIIGYHNRSTTKGPNVVVGRKGTIGRVHYVDCDFWAHDTSLFVTDFHGNHEKYIYYLFSQLDLARYGTKSGSPSLNRNDIHPIWIALPHPGEQQLISQVLTSSDEAIYLLESDAEKLRLLKHGLMQQLLTGTRRVNVLESSIDLAAEAM